jgi:hypothetical protein
MEDHRKSPRHRTFKGGTISFDRGVLECVIRNLSQTGAMLETRDASAVPEEFALIIKPEILRRSCKVMWRDEKLIGVRFV